MLTRRFAGPCRRGEDGFTIIEMTLSLAILALTAAFFAAQLASSYTVYGKARERTLAEELANQTIEATRDLAYDSVVVNPFGVTTTQNLGGLDFTVSKYTKYIADPIPGRFVTGTNYKGLRVIVKRKGKTLADMETLLAPRTQSSLTKGIIKVFVSDFADNTPIAGAAVTVSGGPSPSVTDLTDATGNSEFAGLDPTPATGPTSHYVLTATATDYTVLPEFLPNALAVYPTLAATQTFSTAIQMFKTVSVNARLTYADGTPFAFPATLSISSATRGSGTVPITGGSGAFASFGTTPVIPKVDYTFNATATVFGTPLTGTAVVQRVAPLYPTDLTTTVTIVMPALAPRPTTITTHDTLGNPVEAVTVTITGGDAGVSLSGVTDAAGSVVFPTIPSVAPYQIDVAAGDLVTTAITQPLVVADVPQTIDLIVSAPPQITLTVHDEGGLPLAGITGTITRPGDPSINIPVTTDATGTFVVDLPIADKFYRFEVPDQGLYLSDKVDFRVITSGLRSFDLVLRLL